MTKYLTTAQLIFLNQKESEKTGIGTVGIADSNGLDSIIEQPKLTFFGKEAYPTIWLKAAYIFQKITKKHVFLDGNKRTAWIATIMFLRINGYDVVLPTQIAIDLVMEVTVKPDSEEEMIQVASFLKENAKSFLR